MTVGRTAGEHPVRRVLYVAKTHLDVGFTASAASVRQRYLDDFFPRAVGVAEQLRALGGPARLRWTTGSWILSEALDAADREHRLRLEAAIEHGDLCWHALPFTMHTEYADPSLIRHGLSLSAELDRRFGRRTRAAKATDVPGHTRGLVPLLAEAGVDLLHVGVNPVAAAPSVPLQFRWRDDVARSAGAANARGGGHVPTGRVRRRAGGGGHRCRGRGGPDRRQPGAASGRRGRRRVRRPGGALPRRRDRRGDARRRGRGHGRCPRRTARRDRRDRRQLDPRCRQRSAEDSGVPCVVATPPGLARPRPGRCGRPRPATGVDPPAPGRRAHLGHGPEDALARHRALELRPVGAGAQRPGDGPVRVELGRTASPARGVRRRGGRSRARVVGAAGSGRPGRCHGPTPASAGRRVGVGDAGRRGRAGPVASVDRLDRRGRALRGTRWPGLVLAGRAAVPGPPADLRRAGLRTLVRHLQPVGDPARRVVGEMGQHQARPRADRCPVDDVADDPRRGARRSGRLGAAGRDRPARHGRSRGPGRRAGALSHRPAVGRAGSAPSSPSSAGGPDPRHAGPGSPGGASPRSCRTRRGGPW